MKRLIMMLPFACFACGGGFDGDISNESEVDPDDAPIVPILAAEDGTSPYYIDRLTWGEEAIDFIQVYVDVEGEPEPSVMIYRTTPLGTPDVIDVMREISPVALSTAELWMGITGRSDVPAALVAYHVSFTRERGRSAELSPINVQDIVIEKDAVTDPLIFPAIPSHTWQRRREQVSNMGDGVARYSCSEVETHNNLVFLRAGNVSASNACSTFYNEGGWVRTGAYNRSHFADPALVGQICFGPSTSGAWACHPAFGVPKNVAATLDWVTAENVEKRLGFGLVVQPTLPGSTALWSALWAVGKSVPN